MIIIIIIINNRSSGPTRSDLHAPHMEDLSVVGLIRAATPRFDFFTSR